MKKQNKRSGNNQSLVADLILRQLINKYGGGGITKQDSGQTYNERYEDGSYLLPEFVVNPPPKYKGKGINTWRNPELDTNLENYLEYLPIVGQILSANDAMDSGSKFFKGNENFIDFILNAGSIAPVNYGKTFGAAADLIKGTSKRLDKKTITKRLESLKEDLELYAPGGVYEDPNSYKSTQAMYSMVEDLLNPKTRKRVWKNTGEDIVDGINDNLIFPETQRMMLIDHKERRKKEQGQSFKNGGKVGKYPGGGYVIQKGDTLSALAKSYKISMDELLKLNPQITDPNKIYAGHKLNLPDADVERIRELQTYLNDTYNAKLKVDGILGPKTIHAYEHDKKVGRLEAPGSEPYVPVKPAVAQVSYNNPESYNELPAVEIIGYRNPLVVPASNIRMGVSRDGGNQPNRLPFTIWDNQNLFDAVEQSMEFEKSTKNPWVRAYLKRAANKNEPPNTLFRPYDTFVEKYSGGGEAPNLTDFRITDADLSELRYGSDGKYCVKGPCLKSAYSVWDLLAGATEGVPDAYTLRQALGTTSYKEAAGKRLYNKDPEAINSVPYFDHAYKDYSPDSWDIAALLVDAGGENLYTAGVKYENPRLSTWDRADVDALVKRLPIGTIIGLNEDYRKGGKKYNQTKGLSGNRHSGIVVGYDKDGYPIIYDTTESYTSIVDDLTLDRITNITTHPLTKHMNIDWLAANNLLENPIEELDLDISKLTNDMPVSVTGNVPARRFVKSLEKNKPALMHALGYRGENASERYDELAKFAVALAAQETKLGRSHLSNPKSLEYIVQKSLPYPIGDTQGLTQLNVDNLLKDPALSDVAKEFGIKNKKDLMNPEKSAIATMIYFNRLMPMTRHYWEKGREPGTRIYAPTPRANTYPGNYFLTEEGTVVDIKTTKPRELGIPGGATQEVNRPLADIQADLDKVAPGRYTAYYPFGDENNFNKIFITKKTEGNIDPNTPGVNEFMAASQVYQQGGYPMSVGDFTGIKDGKIVNQYVRQVQDYLNKVQIKPQPEKFFGGTKVEYDKTITKEEIDEFFLDDGVDVTDDLVSMATDNKQPKGSGTGALGSVTGTLGSVSQGISDLSASLNKEFNPTSFGEIETAGATSYLGNAAKWGSQGAALGPIGAAVGVTAGLLGTAVMDHINRKKQRKLQQRSMNSEMFNAKIGPSYGTLFAPGGGMVPIQAEEYRGQKEIMRLPNDHVTTTNADMSHEAMMSQGMGDVATDFVPGGTDIFSARNKTSKKELETILKFLQGANVPVDPSIIDKVPKKGKFSPADLAESAKKTYGKKSTTNSFDTDKLKQAALGRKLDEVFAINEILNGNILKTNDSQQQPLQFADDGGTFGVQGTKAWDNRNKFYSDNTASTWEEFKKRMFPMVPAPNGGIGVDKSALPFNYEPPTTLGTYNEGTECMNKCLGEFADDPVAQNICMDKCYGKPSDGCEECKSALLESSNGAISDVELNAMCGCDGDFSLPAKRTRKATNPNLLSLGSGVLANLVQMMQSRRQEMYPAAHLGDYTEQMPDTLPGTNAVIERLYGSLNPVISAMQNNNRNRNYNNIAGAYATMLDKVGEYSTNAAAQSAQLKYQKAAAKQNRALAVFEKEQQRNIDATSLKNKKIMSAADFASATHKNTQDAIAKIISDNYANRMTQVMESQAGMPKGSVSGVPTLQYIPGKGLQIVYTNN